MHSEKYTKPQWTETKEEKLNRMFKDELSKIPPHMHCHVINTVKKNVNEWVNEYIDEIK